MQKTASPLHLSSWTSQAHSPWVKDGPCWPWGQKVKGQGHNAWGQVKWFYVHNCFPFTPILMKLHRHTPHESRMGPVDFRVKRLKVKVPMHGVRLNGFMCITASPLHQSSWNFTGTLPLSQGWALSASGSKRSKVKVTMHWLLKMVNVA